ncbi:MAG: hypothetical protein ACHRXM_19125 [Isosphaerales bacterium]
MTVNAMKNSNPDDVLFRKRASAFDELTGNTHCGAVLHRLCYSLISVSPCLPKGENRTDDGSHFIIGSRLVLVMKIAARVFIQSTLLLSLVAGPLVRDAVAGSSTITSYGGTVNPLTQAQIQAGITFPGNVVAGDAITGSFGFNSTQFSGSITSGIYTFTGSAPLGQSFSLNVATPNTSTGGWSDFYGANGAMYMITMTAKGSNTPATMDLHVSTVGGPGVVKPGAFIDLTLTSTTYTGGKALPTATTISQFLTNSAALNWDPPGGSQGFTGTIDNFNGVQTPEPSSLVLAIVAMATTGGFLIARRKPARALYTPHGGE